MEKCRRTTSGLASVGVYARGKFRGNLKVCPPFELLRSPARPPSRHAVGCNARERLRVAFQEKNIIKKYNSINIKHNNK